MGQKLCRDRLVPGRGASSPHSGFMPSSCRILSLYSTHNQQKDKQSSNYNLYLKRLFGEGFFKHDKYVKSVVARGEPSPSELHR